MVFATYQRMRTKGASQAGPSRQICTGERLLEKSLDQNKEDKLCCHEIVSQIKVRLKGQRLNPLTHLYIQVVVKDLYPSSLSYRTFKNIHIVEYACQFLCICPGHIKLYHSSQNQSQTEILSCLLVHTVKISRS